MLDGLANSIDEAAQNDWANYSPECYSNRLSHCRAPLASPLNPIDVLDRDLAGQEEAQHDRDTLWNIPLAKSPSAGRAGVCAE
jgi:hypothetical protein